jgi:FAD/FMN-containing dehydrogenase/Fe-S oxidoreductase
MTRLPIIKEEPTAPARTSTDELRGLASAIEGELRLGLHDRMLYATDASLYQVEPLAVVIPASTEDSLRAVEFCRQRGIPILPRGGGTSLAGQCTNRAVVVDFSARCRAILDLDIDQRRVRVEPGITVDDLNDELARRGTGLFFAPDPATSRQCNVGGCIGNNAAGGRSIRYGRTSENVHAVTAAILHDATRKVRLGPGSAAEDDFVRRLTLQVADVVRRHDALIRDRFPKTIRRNAGYGLDMILRQMDRAGPRADADAILREINLAHLLCGSEGTLAVTLEAELLLHPVPKAKGLAVIGFGDLDEAIEATVPILTTSPSAVELLDDTVLNLAAANAEYRRYVDLMPAPEGRPLKAILYVEYFAATGTAEIADKFSALKSLMARQAPTARMSTYTDAKPMAAAWKLRKAGEPLLHGMPGHRKPITFVEDNAVPVENLAGFVRRFRAIVQKYGTNAAFWAHASVGVLHVRPFIDIHDPADREIMLRIAVEVADLARECGGVMSGEHGDGRVRGPLLERFFGPELMGAFREIKAIFDPRNLLNPGNIVQAGPIESIVETLRVKPAAEFVHAPPVETFYDYEDQHGFEGAVEMCNGAGVCRKRSGGTMCPSYMGTLDERHSTRGRGNALRLAITGQLNRKEETTGATPTGWSEGPTGIWNDAETISTLDLCLSCKACKAECPSNVDIARLKAEYTAQRYRSTGHVPLSARVFGHVRTLNRLGSVAPSMANWFNRRAPVRWVLNRLLGLSPKRSIPGFAAPLSRGFRAPIRPGAPTVAIFGDCFTMYNEPGIGRAAARVLSAFGYNVELIDAGCCGRSLISTGLLHDAIVSADAALEKLAPFVANGNAAAIVVCEPSCLSAIKDDWLQLRLRTPKSVREAVAARSFMVEEFLDREWDRHPAKPRVKPTDGTCLLHGHCHQKALWPESSSALLRRLLGDKVKNLDTGCCGMAGSFGYTKKRYDLSMRIGELSLFPSVRATPEAAILAPGTSCRHQIKDGTGRSAMHPIEFIASLLADENRT